MKAQTNSFILIWFLLCSCSGSKGTSIQGSKFELFSPGTSFPVGDIITKNDFSRVFSNDWVDKSLCNKALLVTDSINASSEYDITKSVINSFTAALKIKKIDFLEFQSEFAKIKSTSVHLFGAKKYVFKQGTSVFDDVLRSISKYSYDQLRTKVSNEGDLYWLSEVIFADSAYITIVGDKSTKIGVIEKALKSLNAKYDRQATNKLRICYPERQPILFHDIAITQKLLSTYDSIRKPSAAPSIDKKKVTISFPPGYRIKFLIDPGPSSDDISKMTLTFRLLGTFLKEDCGKLDADPGPTNVANQYTFGTTLYGDANGAKRKESWIITPKIPGQYDMAFQTISWCLKTGGETCDAGVRRNSDSRYVYNEDSSLQLIVDSSRVSFVSYESKEFQGYRIEIAWEPY